MGFNAQTTAKVISGCAEGARQKLKYTYCVVYLQKLFRKGPDDNVEESRVKRMVARCTLFRVLPQEQNVSSHSLPSVCSLHSLITFDSTDMSDVEYLYKSQSTQAHGPGVPCNGMLTHKQRSQSSLLAAHSSVHSGPHDI